jgi:transcriptional regulator with XRE-family HTH domain
MNCSYCSFIAHYEQMLGVSQVIIGSQVRAARGALSISAQDLAELAGVSRRSIITIETGEGIPTVSATTAVRVQVALEARGIEFITAPDGSPGIVIRSQPIV